MGNLFPQIHVESTTIKLNCLTAVFLENIKQAFPDQSNDMHWYFSPIWERNGHLILLRPHVLIWGHWILGFPVPYISFYFKTWCHRLWTLLCHLVVSVSPLLASIWSLFWSLWVTDQVCKDSMGLESNCGQSDEQHVSWRQNETRLLWTFTGPEQHLYCTQWCRVRHGGLTFYFFHQTWNYYRRLK